MANERKIPPKERAPSMPPKWFEDGAERKGWERWDPFTYKGARRRTLRVIDASEDQVLIQVRQLKKPSWERVVVGRHTINEWSEIPIS